MGLLKDALGPTFGAGQVNNGLNGPVSKIKGFFSQSNTSPTPEPPTRQPWYPNDQLDSFEPGRQQQATSSPRQNSRLPRQQINEKTREDGRLSPCSLGQDDDDSDAFSDNPPPYATRDGLPGPRSGYDRHHTTVPYGQYFSRSSPPPQFDQNNIPLYVRSQIDGNVWSGPDSRPRSSLQQFSSSSYPPCPQTSGLSPQPVPRIAQGDSTSFNGERRHRRPRRARGARGAVQPVDLWGQKGVTGGGRSDRAYRARRR